LSVAHMASTLKKIVKTTASSISAPQQRVKGKTSPPTSETEHSESEMSVMDIGGQESPVKTAIGVSAEEEMPAAMDWEKQVALATKAYEDLIAALGPREALRPELIKTPRRAAKAWLELTWGTSIPDPLSVVGSGIFDVEGARDLVVVRDMGFHSICEHHLLPFSGKGAVAYIPNGRVLGLSKFARLLHVFAKRPQLQERLGQQLAEAIVQLLNPRAVAVVLEASHTCMSMRGVQTPAVTRSITLRGPDCEIPATRALLLAGVLDK